MTNEEDHAKAQRSKGRKEEISCEEAKDISERKSFFALRTLRLYVRSSLHDGSS
jgi:hypothetical protein